VAVAAPDGRWLQVNPALCALVDRERDALLATDLQSLTHPDDLPRDLELLGRLVRGEAATCQLETRYVRGDGRWVHVLVSISLVPDPSGQPRHFVVQVQDVTERRLAAERLQHLALHDVLTGLPNRALLVEQLRGSLARLERSGRRAAVLFLDLDRFKNVNDSLGHPVGDQLLGQVAGRLRTAVRPGDSVGRLGGDEFVVLCDDVDEPSVAAQVADRIAAALRKPFTLGGHEVAVTASIGIALARAGDDAADVLRDADAAMYRAKSRGRDRHELFHDALRTGAVERLELEIGLRRALDDGELVLHYQPQVRVADGAVVGVEALVRWQHPERGLVPPGAFLPVAEESRLIVPVGRWVLDEACRQAAVWAELAPELRIAVNVSAHQLTGSEFVDSVAATMERYALPPRRLCVEITEGAFVGAMEFASRTLATLGDLGVELAVDDFGTGYATFDFVRRVHVDTIKIAGEFMRGMERDRRDAGIVASVLTLARALELTAVAEGVETPAQHEYLRRAGCQLAQGFVYARPQPPEAIEPLLRRGTALPDPD
jgi:diguanylate cyclase (GGDEF)-like protein/PAS domain S-box-containing protein